MKPYLQVEDLTKSYGDRMLFDSITFGVNEGDKIGVIAKNGTGKSTLLRLLSGKESPDSGTVTFRNDLRVGFLDQAPEFEPGTTLMHNLLPAIHENDHEEWSREDRVRQMLSQLGIDDAGLTVDHLSGGQLKRAALARVLLGAPDLLILDEPTNHLDMKTKDILKQAIKDFNGTVIVVSHDREFLDGLVEKVYEFGGGKVRECIGGIYEFLESKRLDSLQQLEAGTTARLPKQEKQEVPRVEASEPAAARPEPVVAKISYAEQRERDKILRKAARKVEEAEQAVAAAEKNVADIEAAIAQGQTADDIYNRHAQAVKDLENTMSLWELAQAELDTLNEKYKSPNK